MAQRGSAEPLSESDLMVLEAFFRQPSEWEATAAEVKKAVHRLSPTTVGTSCKRLRAAGLLRTRPGKAKSNGRPTVSYRLLPVDAGLRRVVVRYLSSLVGSNGDASTRAFYGLLGTRALKELVTLDFVRQELARRDVVVRDPGAERELLLPVLGLCHVSSRALTTFLSTWKPYRPEYLELGTFAQVEHVLFRMIFDAVQDLSWSRNTPSGADVWFATVGPENGGCVPGRPTLLELDWSDRTRIGYAAGFDTDHSIVFGEDVEAGGVEMERNPENAWVKLAVVERELPLWMRPDG